MTASDTVVRPRSFWNIRTVLAVLLLAVLTAQCVIFSLRTGETTDEGFFSGGAYPIVRYNDYKFLSDHPPLMYQLAGLPLLLVQPKFSIENPLYVPNTDRIDAAGNGDRFLYKMGNDPQQILFLERFPMIVLTLLLGFGIFLFARSIYGEWGALLALCLYAFTPDILGNGSLFMTDMGVAVFYFFSIYALKRFFDQPDFKRSVALGFICGLAFMTKISALILFPIITFLFFVFLITDPSLSSIKPFPKIFENWFGVLAIFLLVNAVGTKQVVVFLGPLLFLAIYLWLDGRWIFSRSRFWAFALKGLLIAGYTVTVIVAFRLKRKYGFESTFVFLFWNLIAAAFTALFLWRWNKGSALNLMKLFLAIWLVCGLVIVLGYTDFVYKFYRFIGFGNYVKPFGVVLSHSIGGHGNCLERSIITCDWRYFFGLLAIRLPLLVLGLSILGSILLLRAKSPLLTKAIILAPIVFFLGSAILNKINIGIRHILPIFPFLFVLGGLPGAALANMKRGPLKVILVTGLSILLVLFMFRTLRTGPHYLTYFNEAVGDAKQGAKLMPVNWGQDNKSLMEFLIDHKIPLIKIASESSNPAVYDYYKVPWEWAKESDFANPTPGFYAMGLGFYLDQQKNPRSWFKGRQPLYQVGKTFYIFEVTSQE